ncbi:MAG: DUF5700 domain-containing putative Zn-dependent protease [Acidobacteriota bacterium]
MKIDTAEAEAALAIIEKKQRNQPLSESDWSRLFNSEGYVRLKKREAQFKRPFTDEEFKEFMLSDALAQKATALAETLKSWQGADVQAVAGRALAYLPKNARIQAKIYPMIKPQENSFVFEVNSDPAIFLYLDPMVSQSRFENTLAHELHHIGYGSSCPTQQMKAVNAKLPAKTQAVVQWLGAFGEGFAMIAAAGGADVHPHAVSNDEERIRWDKDVANFNQDLRTVEKFFFDVLENRLNEEEENKMGFSFFGVQGAWYTVGWKMCVVIEKTLGREKLIEAFCDQKLLLPTYNAAVKKYNQAHNQSLVEWSPKLIQAINGAIK